jgi:hypothetical protein
VDLTEAQWLEVMRHQVNGLIAYINAAGGHSFPLDGTMTDEKEAAFIAILEANLPEGFDISTVTAEELAIVMVEALGFTDEDAIMASTILATPEGAMVRKAGVPWWHYGLAAGAGVVGGIVIGAFVGYAAR